MKASMIILTRQIKDGSVWPTAMNGEDCLFIYASISEPKVNIVKWTKIVIGDILLRFIFDQHKSVKKINTNKNKFSR